MHQVATHETVCLSETHHAVFFIHAPHYFYSFLYPFFYQLTILFKG